MSDSRILSLPPNIPSRGNRFCRWLGRELLRMMGWKLKGELPNQKQMVVAVAPHTSNWDFFIAMAVVMALGIRVSYLMKKEAFIWPFTRLFAWLGGIPLDRSASCDTVKQIIQWYSHNEKIWVVITPEGTRKKVDRWKTGFLRVAEGANVPVLLAGWDYPSKTFHIDTIWQTTGDHAADAQAVREYLTSKYQGCNPQYQ